MTRNTQSHRHYFLLALAVLLLFLLPSQQWSSLAAQDSDSAAEPVEVDELYVEIVDVNVVNVEVYVTDKKGNFISGLSRADFEVFEDGRPVAVSNFYAVDSSKDQKEGGLTQADRVASGLGSGRSVLEAVNVPEEQRLHLVIYFDNQFLKPFSRNRVVRQVRSFMHTHVKAHDRVMLVTFDKSMHVRHPFTSNRQAIADALFGLEELSAFKVQHDSERKEIIKRIERTDDPFEAEGHVDFYAKSLFHDLTQSLRSLNELVGSLGGLPGRKAILHVSDGLPMVAGEDLFYLLDQNFSGTFSSKLLASRYSAKRNFKELTARANANRVSFYTLEGAGLRSHDSLSAENLGSGGSQTSGGSYIDTDFVRLSNNVETLQMMAYETGGQAWFNTNNIAGALDRVASDFRNYYSLGYFPAASAEGRYHDIEVKVKGRKELRVRHRTGYRSKTAEHQVNDSTVATLLYGVQSNPLEIELQIDRARAREDGNYLLPINVRIPIGKVTLVPRETQHIGKVRVSVAVIDEDGRMSPIEQTRIPIIIPVADLELAQGKFYVYSVELLMRKGNQRVAVGVRDDYAGESSFVRYPVHI